MKKIVINACYGGFSLSPLAVKEYYEKKGKEVHIYISDVLKDNTIKEISLNDEARLQPLFVYFYDKGGVKGLP